MLTEYENAIQNFQFHGLTWGSATAQMKSHFPSCAEQRDGTDESVGQHLYLVTAEGVDSAELSFLDDHLYKVRLLYTAVRCNEMGGWNIVLQRLVEKFGLADAKSKGSDTGDDDIIASYYWRFEEITKYVSIDVYKTATVVEFVDLTALWDVNGRKEKTVNLGF